MKAYWEKVSRYCSLVFSSKVEEFFGKMGLSSSTPFDESFDQFVFTKLHSLMSSKHKNVDLARQIELYAQGAPLTKCETDKCSFCKFLPLFLNVVCIHHSYESTADKIGF